MFWLQILFIIALLGVLVTLPSVIGFMLNGRVMLNSPKNWTFAFCTTYITAYLLILHGLI